MPEIPIIGKQGDSKQYDILLATKRGKRIPNIQRQERVAASLRAAVEMQKANHPDARLRSITNTYNCFGLVFASRRTWIEDDWPRILDEDEYVPIKKTDAQRGDLVLYKRKAKFTHVGVIIHMVLDVSKATWEYSILSKWGGDGEYIHDLNDVPLIFGTPEEFRTETKQT